MTITQDQATALASPAIELRSFLYVEPRDSGGDLAPFAFWSGVGDITATVEDGVTGNLALRTFQGGGNLISHSEIIVQSGLETQDIVITLSQLAPSAALAVRGHDMHLARVDMCSGLFHPGTLNQIDHAWCDFSGIVDECDIQTGAAGGAGSIQLRAVQHSQELYRANPATRSDGDQKKRLAGDEFYKHAASVGDWVIAWGQRS